MATAPVHVQEQATGTRRGASGAGGALSAFAAAFSMPSKASSAAGSAGRERLRERLSVDGLDELGFVTGSDAELSPDGRHQARNSVFFGAVVFLRACACDKDRLFATTHFRS